MKHEKQRIIKFVSNLGSDMIIATRYMNDTMFNHFRENYNLFAYKIPFFLQQFKEIYISTQWSRLQLVRKADGYSAFFERWFCLQVFESNLHVLIFLLVMFKRKKMERIIFFKSFTQNDKSKPPCVLIIQIVVKVWFFITIISTT